ncbi:Putative lipoprotein [hydrothermal vent metagenome]|uniref:Putative lipoprotein n=1 Tax=hydrothermal vent metagenome TaxID=652676 RepID=A0A1W1C037_9ZZZZ
MNVKKSVVASIGLILTFVLLGCAENSDEVNTELGKPALHWYQKIALSIVRANLDEADAHYISLKSVHMRSPLMPTAVMMLAHAHMSKEEYRLANFYLDEYTKRYGDVKSREYIAFMKLTSSFLGVKDVYKDQKLIMDSIHAAKIYNLRYPASAYTSLVDTLLIRLYMSQYLLNENIASLYDRTGKADAAKIYRDKNIGSVVEMTDITAPKKSIVGKVFD